MYNPQPKNFEQLANAVRYYRWFAEVVSPWVGNRVLDVGCGYGNVTTNFLDRPSVHGIDVDQEYIAHICKRFSGRRNFSAELADITQQETAARLAEEQFDTTIAFNVLEHIADDLGAAKNVFTILEP